MGIKAKVYAVTFAGKPYLVQALTKAGACRDLIDHLGGAAEADLATGEQIYAAGMSGERIIGSDKYANPADPNQMPQTGVPETEAEGVA